MNKSKQKKSGSKKTLNLIKKPKLVKFKQEKLHIHNEHCAHDHVLVEASLPQKVEVTPEVRRKVRNKAKATRKKNLTVKGFLFQERHLRPRTAKRRALKTVKRAEMLERVRFRAAKKNQEVELQS